MHLKLETFNLKPILALALALLGLGAGLAVPAQAQSPDAAWSTPANLSHSGAASEPQIVAGPDGRVQVFWHDRFDGLMTAIRQEGAWSAPQSAPILITVEERDQFVLRPIGVTPHIVADALGWVHAFWYGAAGEETGLTPLLHSRLNLGTATWSAPEEVAEAAVVYDVGTGPNGSVVVAYVRDLDTAAFPAGVYVRRSDGGTAGWTTGQAAYTSVYFRVATAEDAHVDATIDAQRQIHLAWNDPHLGRAFYARSADDGLSWVGRRELGDPEQGAARPRVAAGSSLLLLWEAERVAAPCALYQQELAAGETVTPTWSLPERTLEALNNCPQQVDFLRTPQGELLLAAGSGGAQLTLAAWDGTTWSEPELLGFSFEDPELGKRVYLEGLRAALTGGRLAVVGVGQDGEVWFLENDLETMAWAFAPPPPWSEPAGIAPSEGRPGLPAMATDGEGGLHLLWSEGGTGELPGTALSYTRYDGERWTRPAVVLSSPEGKAEQPAITVLGDQLHAVWSGGTNGEIFYSRAYRRDAYAAGGWSDPIVLPAPGIVGAWPQIAADRGGVLHVLYAVPLNEGRGVYATRSEDGGESWSPFVTVFDATAEGWAMVDHASLAVDEQGILHAAWVRAPLPGGGLPLEIHYARSSDRGETWSAPWLVAEEAGDWPQVVTTPGGQVHLLWHRLDGRAVVRHRWATDGATEQAWSYTQQVRGFDGVAAPVAVVPDGAGGLHLVGLGQDDVGEPALYYATWDEERWTQADMVRLGAEEVSGGIAAALQAALGRLHVAFAGELAGSPVEGMEGAVEEPAGLLYAARAVPTVLVTPLPTFTPRIEATPTPETTPTPAPTARPDVNPAPPASGPGSVEFGPLSLPLTALGGLTVAGLMVILMLAVRGMRR